MIIFLLVACTKDDPKEESPTNNEPLQTLEIDETIYSHIPLQEFKTSASIVFVNGANNSKKLNINYEEGYKTQIWNASEPYEAQFISITLIEQGNSREYNIDIDLQASYRAFNRNEWQTSLSVALVNEVNSGLIPWVTAILDGKMLNPKSDMNEITIHNRGFNDVYLSSLLTRGVSSYGELYYNKDVGVVAFMDKNNEVWRFERFEK